jgi:hypothetical protein
VVDANTLAGSWSDFLDGGGHPAVREVLDRHGVRLDQKGSLYHVDLPDEKIAKMLDWDKPLGKQPAHVRKAIEQTKSMLPANAMDDLGGDLSILYGPDVSVSQFLNTWEALGGRTGIGEEMLGKAGIPGIKYLDGGSRAGGKGTRNFVVFNPDDVKILERK